MKLNNEIDKIKVFFKDKNLDKENLLQLLNNETHNDFNSLKDEAISGNKVKTNMLLNNTVIESDKSNFYLAILKSTIWKII